VSRAYTSWTARRSTCWERGAEIREIYLADHMQRNDLTERPLVKDIIDDVLRYGLHARVYRAPLEKNTFAQTELVDGRFEVTLNTRIGEMEKVTKPELVEHVAKWHECKHIIDDFPETSTEFEGQQLSLMGMEMPPPRLIMCRRFVFERDANAEREFAAEQTALAAAIAGPDLRRCDAFLRLESLVVRGGELGGYGWHLLYETSEFIGVNITALVRYFSDRGFIARERDGVESKLYAGSRLLGGFTWP
jgi:hypothetical protein